MRGWGLAGPQHKKGTSHDTHCASGARATELHGVCNRTFRSVQSGHEPGAADAADREYDDHHVSGQLRHAGDELPEFLRSDHRGGDGKSCGVERFRRLQSQLHESAACLQTAVLNEAVFGRTAFAPQRLTRLVEFVEATPGIEPGYTVLQSRQGTLMAVDENRLTLISLVEN